MVRTFYIPNEKKKVMDTFKKNASKNNTSYSKLLVEYMDNYNKKIGDDKRLANRVLRVLLTNDICGTHVCCYIINL